VIAKISVATYITKITLLKVCNYNIKLKINEFVIYICVYTGDTGLRGSIGEPGMKGIKGDQGTFTYVAIQFKR